jgi:Ca2+-binding RTX toxin-like protein
VLACAWALLAPATAVADVTVGFSAGQLLIEATAGESTTLTCVAGDVRRNGVALSPAVPCSAVSEIAVDLTGDGTIDLSAVTDADFPLLTATGLWGHAGSQTIIGSSIGDRLNGYEEDDVLRGGPGADDIEYDIGADDLDGGEGSDTYGVGLGSWPGAGALNAHDSGGSGQDWLVIYGTSAPETITFTDSGATFGAKVITAAGIENGYASGDGGGDTIDASAYSLSFTADGGAGDDVVRGGSGEDVLGGGLGDDEVYGGAGDDWHWFNDGHDVFHDSAGTDVVRVARTLGAVLDLRLGAGQTQAVDGIGSTVALQGVFEGIHGSPTADTLIGNESTVVLKGYGGDDAITVNGSDSTLWSMADGGEGSDSYVVRFGALRQVFEIGDTGTSGSDSVSVDCAGTTLEPDRAVNGAQVVTWTGIETLPSCLGAPPPPPAVTPPPPVRPPPPPPAAPDAKPCPRTMIGTAGADHLVGGPCNDVLSGGAGSDSLAGRAGADALTGGSGRDVLDGGAGPDRLFARDGRRDLVRCGSGRDTALVDRIDVVVGCERTRR